MRKYPRVEGVLSKKKNTSAKCRCGAVAKYKTTVAQLLILLLAAP